MLLDSVAKDDRNLRKSAVVHTPRFGRRIKDEEPKIARMMCRTKEAGSDPAKDHCSASRGIFLLIDFALIREKNVESSSGES